MNVSFMGMYRLIHDLNNKLSVTDCNRVTVNKGFFEDLENVFDGIADMVSYCPLFDSTKKEND